MQIEVSTDFWILRIPKIVLDHRYTFSGEGIRVPYFYDKTNIDRVCGLNKLCGTKNCATL